MLSLESYRLHVWKIQILPVVNQQQKGESSSLSSGALQAFKLIKVFSCFDSSRMFSLWSQQSGIYI